MRKKIANIIVGLLFILFAVVQLNDPDPMKWVLLYGFVAAIALLKAFASVPNWLILIGLAVTVVWLVILIPNIIDWFRRGMPSITEHMKADKPYVELTREFFGLLICIIALLWYYRSGRRQIHKTKGL